VDKKHQIVIDAQAFGEGQEHHTLKPVLDSIKATYKRTGISNDILAEQVVVTADTGFANEANYEYLKEEKINAYIPDNQFFSRDPTHKYQKEKYGKRHRDTVKGIVKVIPASKFTINTKKENRSLPGG